VAGLRRDLEGRQLVARALLALALALGGTGVAFAAGSPSSGKYREPPGGVTALLCLGFVTFAALGLLVVVRAAGHRIGWLLTAIGLLFLTGFAAEAVAKRLAAGGNVGGIVPALSWLDSWAWTVALSLVVITLLLFPTGRPPSAAWRPVVAVAVVAGVAQWAATAFAPGPLDAGAHVTNPLGVPGAKGALHTAGALSGVAGLLLLLAAVVSLFVRFRRAERDERQQIRWVALAALATLSSLPLVALAGALGGWIVAVPFLLAVAAVPSATAVAVLRYRLYDIDIVINRALVLVLLTAVISGVYVGIVVGAGAVIGSSQRVPLSILAAAVVAVAINPARTVLQRLADRVVFGRRATPYQVLTDFADRIAGQWAPDELLPRTVGMTADATGAAIVAVYVGDEEQLAVAATTPPGADVPATLRLEETSGFDLVHAVRDRGVVLGALALRKPSGARVTAADERLVGYLASHAGLMLGHVRLTTELQRKVADLDRQAAELRSSRQRLVKAQDEERRRLERDLHDGAQQDLIAIMAKARLARNQLDRGESEAASGTVAEIQEDAHRALVEVREVARGIFPPVLADRGLVAAIEARAARLPLPVQLEAHLATVRLPADVETAAYFVVAEAFANVLKHAAAEHVQVQVTATPEQLRLAVRDDGRGLNGSTPGSGLTGMRDRIAALGGELTVSRADPRGTELLARIPLGLRP
jgi:signal transduction histidine kinase